MEKNYAENHNIGFWSKHSIGIYRIYLGINIPDFYRMFGSHLGKPSKQPGGN